MDSTLCDKLIRLADVPGRIPPKNGKPIHRSSVFRWVKTGIDGKRLQVVRLGGAMATTLEWLEEFFISLTEGTGLPPATSTQRKRSIDQANAELDAAGI